MADMNSCRVRGLSYLGVKASKVTDLFKVTKPFKSAGYRPGHSVDLHIGLTLSMLGIKHKHVTGLQPLPPSHSS